jgi:thiaminase/transcriptional activator TenA
MAFSDRLLEIGNDVWTAQFEHPFVRELAAGTLDQAAFRHWVEQDYRYLLDYARLFALAGVKADDESTMTHLLGVAHQVLDEEMDLHRSFAAEFGIDEADLERVV